MTKVTDILDALRTAVNEGASLPQEEREALFKRSFEQAGAELAKAVAPGLPSPAELDHVSLFGTVLETAGNAVAAIEAGEAQPVGGARPSDEVLTLAKAWLDLGGIALVAMASEQAAPTDSAQPEEGMSLVKVALGEGEGGEVLVKTALPEALHDLIAPPDAVAAELAALGEGLYAFAGGDALAKMSHEDGEDEGYEDEDEMEDEPEGGVAEGLETLAKLGQMAVMQVAAIKDEIGDADEIDAEAGGLSALDAIAAHGAFMTQQAEMLMRAAAGEGEDDEAVTGNEDLRRDEEDEDELRRSAKTGDLAKGQAAHTDGKAAETAAPQPNPEVEALKKQLAETADRLAKLEAQPADGKAVLKAPAGLSKQADNGAEPAPTLDSLAEDLMKMSPEERSKALFKMALSAPVGSLGAHNPV